MIQSAGIALVVKSLLGTSPISSLPYVLSLISPFTFGQTTFAVNMVFVVFELLMLRRDFPAVFWLQIPVTILFGFCIDFFMNLFTIVPDAYALKLLLCLPFLAAAIVSAFSVTFTRLPDGRRDSFRLWPHTPRLAHAAKDAIRSIFVRYAAPMGRPYGTASACTRSVPRFRWLSPSPA